MKDVYVFRNDFSDVGTFGVVAVPYYKWSGFCGELPWRDNEQNVSCVLDGVYKCVWEYSNRFKRFMYELKDVPYRTECKLHSFNYCGDKSLGLKSETEGCLAFGNMINPLCGQKAILNTRHTISMFELLLRKREFNLIIRSAK